MHHWYDQKEDNFDKGDDDGDDGWDCGLPTVICYFSNAVGQEEEGISEIQSVLGYCARVVYPLVFLLYICILGGTGENNFKWKN